MQVPGGPVPVTRQQQPAPDACASSLAAGSQHEPDAVAAALVPQQGDATAGASIGSTASGLGPQQDVAGVDSLMTVPFTKGRSPHKAGWFDVCRFPD